MEQQSERNLVEHGVFANLTIGVLEQRGHVACNVARGNFARIQPRNNHIALGWLEQTVEQLGERGFARAVLADDADDFTREYLKIERSHRCATAWIRIAHTFETNHRLASVRGRWGNNDGIAVNQRVTNHRIRKHIRRSRRRTHPFGIGTTHAYAYNAGNKRRRLINGKRRIARLAQPLRRERVRHTGDARAVNANRAKLLAMSKHFARRTVEYQFSLVEHNYTTAVLREQRNLLLDYHHSDAG